MDNIAAGLNRVQFGSTPVPHRSSLKGYKKNRNPQYVPSDDDDDSSIEQAKKVVKRGQQMNNEISADLIPRISRPSRTVLQPLRQTRSDGSMVSLNSINKMHSADDLSRIQDDDDLIIGYNLPYDAAVYYQQQKQPQQQLRMSGMDLLIQREEERAKRQKQKNGPKKIKIEGLLGNVPQPGSHNISFQQLQLEQQQAKSKRRAQPLDCYGSPMMYSNPAYYSLPSIPTSNGLYMNYAPPSGNYNNRQSSGSSVHFV